MYIDLKTLTVCCICFCLLCLFIYSYYSTPLLELSECIHTTVIKDMCADCGADLRQNENVGIQTIIIIIIIKQYECV